MRNHGNREDLIDGRDHLCLKIVGILCFNLDTKDYNKGGEKRDIICSLRLCETTGNMNT